MMDCVDMVCKLSNVDNWYENPETGIRRPEQRSVGEVCIARTRYASPGSCLFPNDENYFFSIHSWAGSFLKYQSRVAPAITLR